MKFFLLGMGYSVAWFAALLNTYVVAQRLIAGQPTESFLPVALGAWVIILYFHFRAGWFPFRRRRPVQAGDSVEKRPRR